MLAAGRRVLHLWLVPSAIDRLQGALAGRYAIERELGGGGMSRVFLAREIGLNREVVIKVLPDEVAALVSIERFSREIQLAASLQQANIVPLLTAGDAGGVPYFTMPFVQGESLRTRLRAGPPLAMQEIMSILRDVARALSYAHKRGVVHRDIKPDNVLLSHGAAVVTDFGIAKAVVASRTEGGAETLTQAGASIGTPAYMAPEQVASDPGVDLRADLYSWGCMAYELLTGMAPFVNDSPHRVLAMHLGTAPQDIGERRPDIPAPLRRLVMRCLAKDVADRPADADEVLRELDAVASATPQPARVESSAGRNARWMWVSIAGALAVAAVTLVLLSNRQTQTEPATSTDRSIAVLPLTNLSGDASDNYLGIGLAEEMTRALAKAGVRVIGRTSAGALQARGLDDRAIANQLGVGSLLSGSIQRAGDQLRISVTLSAADGAVRWSNAYDRPITNIFAVQDEIAREVSRELLGTLNVAAAGTLVRHETSDPQAHALLLQGIALWNRRSEQFLRQALGLFEQAVARDPEYARAQAWLALGNNTLAWYTDDVTDTYLDRAMQASDRALALDSTVAEAHASAAVVLWNRFRDRESEERFQRAIKLDSTLALSWGWSAMMTTRRGSMDEALRRVRHAVELEPASLVLRTQVAQILQMARRFPEADSVVRSVVALDSSFGLAWMEWAETLAAMGRFAEAIEIMEKRALTVPGVRRVHLESIHAWMLARAGRTADARAALARLRDRSGGRLPPEGAAAAALEALGEVDAAIDLLGEAIDNHDPWLWNSRGVRYDRLRKHPRAAALFARVESP